MSYYKRGLTVLGGPVTVGADPDKATVEKFQGAIIALPPDKMVSEFTALKKAISSQTNAYGVWGPATKAAAAKFNQLYGDPSEGANITATTLAMLDRPDLKTGSGSGSASTGSPSASGGDASASDDSEGGVMAYLKSLPTWQLVLGGVGILAVGYATYRLVAGGTRDRRTSALERLAA